VSQVKSGGGKKVLLFSRWLKNLMLKNNRKKTYGNLEEGRNQVILIQ
jgi:hypothetical protein